MQSLLNNGKVNCNRNNQFVDRRSQSGYCHAKQVYSIAYGGGLVHQL
jgi:hypothetical protein